jgi:hypothetical protein
MITSIREIARALGGEAAGAQVLAPGPGHGPQDRSLSVKIVRSSPLGFIAHSFSGDDWRACRDHVAARLGIEAPAIPAFQRKEERFQRKEERFQRKPAADGDAMDGVGRALALWGASANPNGTRAHQYLTTRGLDLGDDIAGDVIRWHPRVSAMVALFRCIATGEPRAISRTYLDAGARKIERKFLGPVCGAAVMLDPFDAVAGGLHVGEGVETCMSARQLGLKPAWALGSAGAIAAFPVLDGIECLTLLAEHDDASARATEACAARWHAAGCEVLINRPLGGKDLNDAIRGAA